MLVLPRRPPLGGDVLAEQGPRLLHIDLARYGELVAPAALERPLLGEGAPLGQEDAGRALPLALLVADLVALVGVAWGRRDNGDPGHVLCLLVSDGRMTPDPHAARVPHGFRTSRTQRTSCCHRRLTDTLATSSNTHMGL